jgi:hypothetical protein
MCLPVLAIAGMVTSIGMGAAGGAMQRNAANMAAEAARIEGDRRMRLAELTADNILAIAQQDRMDAGREGEVAIGTVLARFASSGFDVGAGNAVQAVSLAEDVAAREQENIQYNAQLDAWRVVVSGEADLESARLRAAGLERAGQSAFASGFMSGISGAVSVGGSAGLFSG